MSSSLSKRIVAFAFCTIIFLGCGTFSTRAVAGLFLRNDLPCPRFFMWLTAGGAEEIIGTGACPTRDPRHIAEWETTQNIPFRRFLLETAATLEKHAGWNLPILSGKGNDVYEAHGRFLGRTKFFKAKNTRRVFKAFATLVEHLANRGVPVLFIVPPSRFGPEDAAFRNAFDFKDPAFDEKIAIARENGALVLDLRPPFAEAGLWGRNAYFATDHHLLPETTLFAARLIGQKISDTLGRGSVDFSALEDESFQLDVIPASFLGAIGRKATLARCTPDDFSIITARAPSLFRLEIPGKGISRTGGGEIFLNMNELSEPDPYKTDRHSTYLFDNNPIVRLSNLNPVGKARILFFADSMDNALSSFLINGLTEIISIDFRDFQEPIDDLLDLTKPDMVVLFWEDPDTPSQLPRRIPSLLATSRKLATSLDEFQEKR